MPPVFFTDTPFVEAALARLVEGAEAVRAAADALIDHAADATVAVTEVDLRDATIQAERSMS